MPHRGPLGYLRGEQKQDDTLARTSSNRTRVFEGKPAGKEMPDVTNGDSAVDISVPRRSSDDLDASTIHLLEDGSPEQDLWGQAWDHLRDELEKMLPPEIQDIGSLDAIAQVQEVHDEAQRRAQYSENNQRRVPFLNKTYREIYGKVARCANDFQVIGNMVAQAEPIYTALPWALIQFSLQCAVGEDEAYHTMLSGIERVSDLVSQYRALEYLYAKLDTIPSQKLRKSLVKFYSAILRFQVYTIRYFDQNRKGRRALIGFNPIMHGDIQQRQQEVDSLKREVDADAVGVSEVPSTSSLLVPVFSHIPRSESTNPEIRPQAILSHEVEKLGLDSLKVSQTGQDTQLEAIKEGIIALAGNTGRALQDLNRDQEERSRVLIRMWKGKYF